jgi:hypothetical protein
MSNPADENTTDNVTPVKLKKTRKKYAEPKPDDKRLKANQQRSEAQIAAQFKPGNEASKQTLRVNNAKKNREFRDRCRKILNEAALPMLIDRLYDSHENMETKHFIELLKFLTLYGIGKPAEMEVEEEVKVDSSIINNIVISQEMLSQAILNDNQHLNNYDSTVIDE